VNDELLICFDCGFDGDWGSVRWAVDTQCYACYLIECRERQEARLVAAKAIAAMEPSAGRDYLLNYIRL
jgi:hypothetical protein